MRMRIWLPVLALALVVLATVVGCGGGGGILETEAPSVFGTVGAMPRRDAERNRQKLLDAGREVFAERIPGRRSRRSRAVRASGSGRSIATSRRATRSSR